nr:hypothetical protein [Tanacetum cinerariifolium]
MPCQACFSCGRPGHMAKDCRVAPRMVNPVNDRNLTAAPGACYECGGTDHFKEACTRGGSLGPEHRDGIKPSKLGFSYEIKIASGQLVEIDKVISDCKLKIEGHVFDINLIPFGSGSFDVIIGMDWLSNHKAEIICHEKVVRIPLQDGKVLNIKKKTKTKQNGQNRARDWKKRRHLNNLVVPAVEIQLIINLVDIALASGVDIIIEGLDGDDNDEDYDKESIISTNTNIFEIPSSDAITTSLSILPNEDLEDSLIMGNEELSTIPEKESDEFIKSSVEDLFPIPSESEDTSGSKSSLSDEDVPEDNVKIYSNPLFEFDDEHISSDVNPLFDKALENIKSKDSNLDEPDLLVTPLSDANKDECFDLGGDVDEINDCEDGYNDSEGDILYLESFLSDDTTLNLPPKVFLDRDLRSLSDAPIDDLMSEDKNFDIGICVKKISPTYVILPFEDRHYLFFTYVV